MNELKQFNEEYERVTNFDYIKSLNNQILKTLQSKLKNNYSNLDIIFKKDNPKNYLNIFKANFENKKETSRLREKYGYSKLFECKPKNKDKYIDIGVQANCSTLGGRHLFRLFIDKENKKVVLNIYNKNYELLDKNAYWSFKTLEEKLNKKNQYLANIKYWLKEENNQEYYKFYDVNYYHLLSFDKFLKYLESGKIRINIQIKYADNIEKISKRIAFEILELDILDLYEKVNL